MPRRTLAIIIWLNIQVRLIVRHYFPWLLELFVLKRSYIRSGPPRLASGLVSQMSRVLSTSYMKAPDHWQFWYNTPDLIRNGYYTIPTNTDGNSGLQRLESRNFGTNCKYRQWSPSTWKLGLALRRVHISHIYNRSLTYLTSSLL